MYAEMLPDLWNLLSICLKRCSLQQGECIYLNLIWELCLDGVILPKIRRSVKLISLKWMLILILPWNCFWPKELQRTPLFHNVHAAHSQARSSFFLPHSLFLIWPTRKEPYILKITNSIPHFPWTAATRSIASCCGFLQGLCFCLFAFFFISSAVAGVQKQLSNPQVVFFLPP